MREQIYNLSYENLNFSLNPQTKIHAWFIKAPAATRSVILCHGNAGNISDRLHLIYNITKLKLNVLIFDYPSYGKSTGKISEENIYKAAEEAWNFLLTEKKVRSNNIIIWGRSLGGAVAAHLSLGKKAHSLILESTFTSLSDIAAERFKFFPVRKLARFKFATQNILPQIQTPILFIHSRNDEIIPFSHSHKLFKTANKPKTLLEISGGHNDGWYKSKDKYFKTIKNFIDSVDVSL